MKDKREVIELLNQWISEDDIMTRTDAVRALASLATIGKTSISTRFYLIFIVFVDNDDLYLSIYLFPFLFQCFNSTGMKGPKYSEGIYLLYPEPVESNDTERFVDTIEMYNSGNSVSYDFDIVFIHGVTGTYRLSVLSDIF